MKHSLILLITFCLTTTLPAQNAGKVIEQVTISSTVLGRAVNYTVYLPADYDRSERNYPVVYLLHGYTDDNTGSIPAGYSLVK